MTAVPSTTLHGDGHGVHHDRDPRVDELLNRVQRPALLAAAAGIVLLLIGAVVHHADNFFQAYLYAYLFWTGISLGCFSILLLAHLVGGTWGAVIRRPLEAGSRLIPLMAVLFVPILFGIHRLYEWDHDSWRQAHNSELMWFKLAWLSKGWFIVRTVIYFAVWITLMLLINRWGDEQDRTADPRIFRRLQSFAGPGLVIYVATMTLAAVDWAMSLDAAWLSTIYGLLFVVGQALGTMALVIALMAALSAHRPFAGVVSIPIFHDLGNLLMAFTMLWAYFSFSQYLIIWSANIAEETPYYVARTHTGWKYVALFLVVFHFFVPFLLLLWRRTKRNLRALMGVAGSIAVLRLVDLFWVIVPSFGHEGAGHGSKQLAEAAGEGGAAVHGAANGAADAATQAATQMAADGAHAAADAAHHGGWWHAWMYPAAAAAIGGLFVFAFVWQLKRRPLLPLHDPRLEALAAGGHH